MVSIMKMNFNLNLVQTQKLIMTPELKQAIEILQFNALELNEFINEELLNNPILERLTSETEEESHVDKQEQEFEYDLDKGDHKEVDWEDMINYFDESRPMMTTTYNTDSEINYDNFVADEETLKDYLDLQLKLSKLEDDVVKICEYIIENIDDNGYLQMRNEEAVLIFNRSNDEIEQLVRFIQTFDPPGVGARNIKECLLIQMYQQGFEESLEELLVTNHLEELSEKKFVQIAKKIGETAERIQQAYDYIKTLEPKPGRSFSSSRDVRYVIPDVYVEKVKDEYIVTVNESASPRLQINGFYKSMLHQFNKDSMTNEYLSKNLQSALRIIKSIEQRRNTIYRVCKAIIEYQVDFFEKGMLYLRPLNLKDIADEIEVHESTVSRAVNGKYMQCPNGLFEIKYFFQSGVKGASGEGVSSESVKSVMKDMIEKENPKKPLSDQYIADELVKAGINISRRTVAKYRDELNIPPSSKRKRF
ncbi:MAG TPA: RNA polymerase sigma-54 factor [Clostridiales bacterium UBA8960]|nr:RNA polymerase sigma-54 factor [Clostridiales bacterium UBA8960]